MDFTVQQSLNSRFSTSLGVSVECSADCIESRLSIIYSQACALWYAEQGADSKGVLRLGKSGRSHGYSGHVYGQPM